jgi:hypothetical protein
MMKQYNFLYRNFISWVVLMLLRRYFFTIVLNLDPFSTTCYTQEVNLIVNIKIPFDVLLLTIGSDDFSWSLIKSSLI